MCGGGPPWAGKHNVSGKNTWAGVRRCNGSRPVLQGAARGSVCVCAYVHCVHSDPVCAGHTCPTVSNTPDFVWINTKILAFPRPCGTNGLYRSPFGSAQTVAIAGHQARAISLELDERAKSDRAIEMFEHAPDGKLCDRPRQADRRRQVWNTSQRRRCTPCADTKASISWSWVFRDFVHAASYKYLNLHASKMVPAGQGLSPF